MTPEQPLGSPPTREVPKPSAPPATRDMRVPLAPTRDMPLPGAAGTAPPIAPRRPRPPQLPYDQMAQDPISRLLRAIKEVAIEGYTVLKHPRDFPERLELDDRNLFIHGTRFLLGTVPAIFVLLLPVHMVHGRPATQTAVGLMFTGVAFSVGPLVHLFLKMLGARKTSVSTTVGLYSYVMGFQGLLTILLSYPIGFRFGSKLYFGGSHEEIAAIEASMTTVDQQFFVMNWLLVNVVLMAFLFLGFIPLFANYYDLKRPRWLRAATAVVIPLLVAGAIYQAFMPQIRRAADSL